MRVRGTFFKGHGNKTITRIFLLAALSILLALLFSVSAVGSGADEVIRVSTDAAGGQGNSVSIQPSISDNGRFVAFSSKATNYVSDDESNNYDVYVKNTQTGDIDWVSSGSPENPNYKLVSLQPAISGNGRYVAYTAGVWIDESAPWIGSRFHIFVKDMSTGITNKVSTDSAGNQGDSNSELPSISADGRYVAFSSNASNLAPGDTNNSGDVFVKDTQTGQTTLVSSDSTGNIGVVGSVTPDMSADGRYVAFCSQANNLVPGGGNGKSHVFVKDLQAGVLTLISTDSDNQKGNENSGNPSISADGRYVTFDSSSDNLIPSDTNNRPDVFVKDMLTRQTVIISTDSDGRMSGGGGWLPSISTDGRFVTFNSYQGGFSNYSLINNLADVGGGGPWRGVYIKNLQNGNLTIISTDSAGNKGDGDSASHSVSAGGRYVAFESSATNFVPDDTNNVSDIFLAGTGFNTQAISGHLHDGQNNDLESAKVSLINNADQPIGEPTTSDSNGNYSFPMPSAGDYKVQVELEYTEPGKDTAVLQMYVTPSIGSALPAKVTKNVIVNESSSGDITLEFDFSKPEEFSDLGGLPGDDENRSRLQAAASIWHWTYESYKVAKSPAAEITFDYELPIEIYVYDKSTNGAFYSSDSSIHIGDSFSSDKPWIPKKNREWHEFGHAIMYEMYSTDAYGYSTVSDIRGEGDRNHWGYANSSTGDSLIEGFAEFWACLTAARLDMPDNLNPNIYDDFGNIELDHKAWWPMDTWEGSKSYPKEELAVAGVLWDLLDGPNGSEPENVSLGSKTILDNIWQNQPNNMNEYYQSLLTSGLNLTSLDSIFERHGFFSDILADPVSGLFWSYQQFEPIGFAGNGACFVNFLVPPDPEDGLPDDSLMSKDPRPDRKSRPYAPDLNANIKKVDSNGNPVAGGNAHVSVTFPAPYDGYNYSYDKPLDGTEGDVYIDLPSDEYSPVVSVTLNGPRGSISSDELSLDSTEYFNLAQNAADGSFVTKTFVTTCGKPDLSLSKGTVHWASYADYTARELTVQTVFSNNGTDTAYEVTMTEATCTNDVTLSSPIPFNLGDLVSGASAEFGVKYHIPVGVGSFTTNVTGSATDACGTTYTYP